ncbi:gas vesicle accessory protein GvpU [Methylotenera sp. G11]|uniref:gas vesicle accessory protein GvpU n=1 Tax=Methylotenera sp. G11 TaxID=1506585 RepID=UPI00068A9A58|nr:gas vesicle accessory protein GvpU [Methylotenera sp. G11]
MTNEAEIIAPPLVAETDWFLQSLVSFANEASLEIGITLQVSGMLVSGNLVSHKQYFDGFATEFSSAFTNSEDAESIKTNISSYGDLYKSNDENKIQPPPQYIHLKNTRFFNTAGNPIPGNKGVWWRGRICEVGGFSLGSLSASQG